jgi:hypothetical protein
MRSKENYWRRVRKFMRKLIAICLVCVLLSTAASQGTVISFNENGQGDVDGTPLYSDVGPTPVGIPGHITLFYGLPEIVVEGDVVIYEPDALGNPTSVISGILRFDLAAAPASFVFVYSDLGGSDLADTEIGIPPVWYDGEGGVVYFPEEKVEGGWGLHYTPGPDDPGYYYIEGGEVTYIFTSDIPEPATIGILGFGALSLIRRKK